MANFFDQFDAAPAPASPAPAANFFDQFDSPAAPKVPSWAEHAGPQPDAMGNVTGGLDTGMNVPETPATIAAQQDQLVTGRKPAIMFPKGTAESPLPEDFARVETDRGVFHYDPTKYKAADIRAASKAGKENDLLGLGPFSKPEIDARVAKGEVPVAVTERQPDGTEVKSAIGTAQTAPEQIKALDKTKTPGNIVAAEPIADVVSARLPADVPLPPPRPAGLGVNEADVPLPPVRPPVNELNPVAPLDDAGAFRTGGKVGDALLGSQTGMLTGEQAAAEREANVAAARADLAQAKADADEQKRIWTSGDDADEQTKLAKSNMRAALTLAPRNVRRDPIKPLQDKVTAAEKAVKDAETAPLPTQSAWRSNVEQVPSTVGNQLVDTAAGATRMALGVGKVEAQSQLMQAGMSPEDAQRMTKGVESVADPAFSSARGKITEGFTPDQARANELGSKIVQGFASTAGFVATGAVGRVLKLSPMVVTAIAGALPSAEQGWQDASRNAELHPDFPEWKKWANFAIGAGSGATEALPIGHLFQRLEKASGGGFTRWIGMVGAQAGEEGLQEGLQQLIQNSANAGLLGSSDPLDKDVANNMLIGAMVGGGMAGVLGAAGAVRGGGSLSDRINEAANVSTPAEINDFLKSAKGSSPAEIDKFVREAETIRQNVEAGRAPGDAGNPRLSAGGEPAAATVKAEPAANYFDQFDAPAAPEAAQEPAGAAPAPTSETASPEAEAAPALPDTPETRILRKAGYADEDIGAMGTAQIAEEVKAAAEEGITDPGPDPDAGLRDQAIADAEKVTGRQISEDEYRGTRAKPAKVTTEADLEPARAEVAEPTEAQKEAGNYSKGHAKVDGFDVTIENAKGSVRSGKDADGKPWQTTLPADYGYIKGSKGADGDHVDTYIGPHGATGKAFVVEQHDPKTGKFDELKVVMGVNTTEEARAIYDAAFSDGSGPQRGVATHEMSTADLRTWLDKGGGKGKVPKRWRTDNSVFNHWNKDGVAESAPVITPAQATVPPIEPNSEQALDVLEDVANAAEENQNPKTPDDFEKAIRDRILAVPGMTADDINKEALEDAAFKAHSGEVPIEEAYARAAMEIAERDLRVMEKERAAAEHRQTKAVEKPAAAKVKPAAGPVAENDQRPAVRSAESAGPDEEGEVLAVGKGPDGGVRAAENPAPDGPGETEAAAGRSDTQHVDEAKPAGLVDALKKRLQGDGFKNILDARRLAKENGFKPAEGTPENKQIEEAIENALVEAGREVVQGEGTPQEKYDSLVDLYNKQPRLGTRTSASVAEQAYSTPLPLAYVASQLAGITDETSVLEPTAGNGALLMSANPKKTTANEINPVRAAILAKQGFKVTRHDGSVNDFGNGYQVVIANPPFGVVRDGGETRQWKIDGLTTSQIDHAIALNALSAMDADGRAVLIIGGIKAESDAERAKGYTGKSKREFFYRLGQKYKIVDHFTVSGDLYERQGAAWPVDVIVIHGRGKSDRKPPSAQLPVVIKSWGELKGKLDDIGSTEQSGRSTAVRDNAEVGAVDEGGKSIQRHPRDEALGGTAVDGGGVAGPAQGSAERNADVVGATDNRGQPADQGQRPADIQAERPGAEPVRERRRADIGADTDGGRPRVAEDTNAAGQLSYKPASKEGKSLGTLVPANLQQSTQESLARVQRKHGNIDDYVADELGYKVDDLGKYFSAEQVDATALGLNNIEAGDGFILGDATGVGKGRVVAAMIRYAHQKGMTPVFVTEKPDLYGDMWRDLHDIGFDKSLGRPIKMFMTNSNTRVALDDEAVEWVADSEVAKANGEKVPARRGTFSSSQTPEAAVDDMRGLLDGSYKPDVVFTTYDQMNSVKGAETPRRQFLRAVANRSLIILDEAHNAGGQGEAAREDKKKAVPRAKVFREALKDAKAVVYSSATYAKSPKVMDLFARTDMSKAVEKASDLPDLIARGGVPLQQAVSTMLAKAGQYIRRERSFEGVSYDIAPVDVDEKTYANFTKAIRSIFQFDLNFGEERTQFLEQFAKDEGAGSAKDEGVGEGGAHATAFASVMHNIIGQMILSIKADQSARLAIDAIRAGKKPVIALSQTMESFLKDYADAAGIKEGDAINADFTQVLMRYLERTRRVTVKQPSGDKEHVYITDDLMSPGALRAYRAAEDAVKGMDFGMLSISPIDRIRHLIEEEGYTIREVTGRSNMIDYSGDMDTLKARPSGEKGSSGKRVTIKMFNDGKLDAVILNKSGSTGVSLHASEKYKDQRPRVMIIVQADANVDTHMQMLGRVHRTGQVALPAYQQVMANIPAEVRPAAVLMKKMASLNANTTASRKSVFTGEALDFMNEYGDRVIAHILADDGDLAYALGNPKVGEKPYEGVAARVTGRLTLLEPKEQQELLDRIAHDYKTEIDALDAAGENMLEAKSIDLKAQPVDASTLKPSIGPSPFQSAVNMEKMSVKAQGRAMAPDEITSFLASNMGIAKPDASFGASIILFRQVGEARKVKQIAAVREEAQAHAKREVDALKATDAKTRATEAAQATWKRWMATAGVIYPGATVNIEIGGETVQAIVLGVKRGEKVKNPISLSGWEATFALPTSRRTVAVPFSKLVMPGVTAKDDEKVINISPATNVDYEKLAQKFEEAKKEGRENRFIMTGNILAGYDQTGGNGQIVNFTMDDGSIRAGILMNRAFDPKKFLGERKVRFKNGDQVIKFLEEPKVDGKVVSTDNVIAIRSKANYRGGFDYEFEVPTSKGKHYYTDSDVRKVYDSWVKLGSKMRANIRDRAIAVKMVDALMGLDATFETSTNQDVAQQIVGGEAPKAMASIGADVAPKLTQKAKDAGLSEAHLKNVVLDIIERTTGIPRDQIEQLVRFHEGSVPLNAGDAALDSYGYTSWQKAKVAATGALGMYTPRDGLLGLIDIAMGAKNGNPANTAHHETLHLLQDMGVFTKQEWSLLTYEGPRLRRLLSNVFGRGAEKLSHIEAAANVYGYYAEAADAGRPISGLHIGVRRIFEKIYQVLRRIRNYFVGLGFQTSEDIFERARTGGMAVQNRNWDLSGNQSLLANNRNTRSLSIAPEKSWGDTRSKFVEQAFDRMLRLREAQEHVLDAGAATVPDVYRAETLSHGRVNERAETLWKEHVELLQKAMKTAGIDLEQLHQFLYARHAEERNDVIAGRNPGNPVYADGGSGMETGEANTILANVASSGKQAEYEALADRVYAILKEDNNRRLGAGLMDQDTVDAWDAMYQHYAPLQGFEGDEDSKHGTGSGLKVRGNESRAALGRKSRADNIVVNVINKAVEGIIRSEKNRVGNMVLRLARADIALGQDSTGLFEILKRAPMKRALGDDGVVRSVPEVNYKGQKDIFVTKVGGKEIAIRIHDHKGPDGTPRLAAALNGLLTYDLDGALQIISATTRFRSRLLTIWNPLFPPRNFVRDIEDASIYAASKGIGKEFIAALPGAKRESFKAIFGKESPLFRQFRLSGGKVTYSDVKTIDEIRNRIRRSFQGMTIANIGRKLGSILEHWNDLFEATTRFALYKAALDAGKSEAEAASIALEGTLNFYRRGAARIMEVAAATNPFWNAKMQAPLRAGRLFKFNRRYRRIMAGLIVTGFLQGMLNYFVGGDDDDGVPFFDKILMGSFENERNIIVYTGSKDSRGRPNGLKIPSFPEVMFPLILGQTIAAAIFGKQPLAALVGRNLKALWQVSPLEGWSFVPPIVKPMVDVHNNEDWTGRNIHNDPFPNQKGVASSEIMRPNTDKKWQQIARLIGTAGEAVSPVVSAKFLDLHPEDVRYLVKEYTGAAYGLAEYMAGKLGVTDSTGDPRLPPIARDFVLQGRAHEAFDRADVEKREGKARTEKMRITGQFAKPGQTASETHRENKRSRDEIEAAGGRVGQNGGINTISTEIFDTGRAVVRSLYKQMAAIKEQKISQEEKARKVQDVQSQILDARRKYSELEKKAKAGKGDIPDISNELRETRRNLRHLETAQ